MTLTRILSITQVATLGVATVGLCVAEEPAAAYIEGTVEAVPAKATGVLKVDNANTLHFLYGNSDLAIPGNSIRFYKWGRRINGVGDQFAVGAKAISHTLLPMLRPDSKLLTVNFKTTNDSKAREVVFSVPKSQVGELSPLLNEWLRVNNALPSVDSEEIWWGNRYWRTNRNRAAWDAAAQKPNPASREAEVASREDE